MVRCSISTDYLYMSNGPVKYKCHGNKNTRKVRISSQRENTPTLIELHNQLFPVSGRCNPWDTYGNLIKQEGPGKCFVFFAASNACILRLETLRPIAGLSQN